MKPVKEGEALGRACRMLVRGLPDPDSGIRINPLHVPALSPPCSYSRDQPIFLQLKDYFWVKAPSAYELPYGTKGSGEYCLCCGNSGLR